MVRDTAWSNLCWQAKTVPSLGKCSRKDRFFALSTAPLLYAVDDREEDSFVWIHILHAAFLGIASALATTMLATKCQRRMIFNVKRHG